MENMEVVSDHDVCVPAHVCKDFIGAYFAAFFLYFVCGQVLVFYPVYHGFCLLGQFM